MSIIKVNLPILYSSMKKLFIKIRLIFDLEKWLWKSELCYIWPSIPNQTKYLEPFYGRCYIVYTFGFVYSPLNLATLSCSSEVTLVCSKQGVVATIIDSSSTSVWIWLSTRTLVANLSWQNFKMRHVRLCTLSFQYDMHINTWDYYPDQFFSFVALIRII